MAEPVHHPASTLRADLEVHARILDGRVPAFTALYPLLAARAADPRFEEAWAERSFSAAYDRPLLILAALRDGALAGPAHPLAAALADAPTALPTAEALDAALAEPAFWATIRTRHVQTNETSRAVAWLLAAAQLGWEGFSLVDLGCSAGLNLVADRLPFPWIRPSGAPVITGAPRVGARLGLDLRPLDAKDPAVAHWLRACVWPGETLRLARLDAALAAFRADPPPLLAAPLAEAPAVLRTLPGPVLAYQTVVRDYLPVDDQRAHAQAMTRWVEEGADRAWVELEYVSGGDPCGIVLHRRDERRLLGATGYHPSVVRG